MDEELGLIYARLWGPDLHVKYQTRQHIEKYFGYLL